MRFTGQMFFDGAHTQCGSDSDITRTPRRFAAWEIHSVYAMDVCKFTTKAKCRVDRDADWASFGCGWMRWKGMRSPDTDRSRLSLVNVSGCSEHAAGSFIRALHRFECAVSGS